MTDRRRARRCVEEGSVGTARPRCHHPGRECLRRRRCFRCGRRVLGAGGHVVDAHQRIDRRRGQRRRCATATLTFGRDGSTLAGSTGCNQFAGTYAQEGTDLTIMLGPVTLAACADPAVTIQEAAILAHLPDVASFSSDDQLTLEDSSGAALLTYGAGLSTIAGTSWTATGVNNGTGGLESNAAMEAITAEFGSDGTLSGFAGCNNYNATYTLTADDAISITGISTTRMACAEPAMTVESQYLAALERAAAYELSGDTLRLRDAGRECAGDLRDRILSRFSPHPPPGAAPLVEHVQQNEPRHHDQHGGDCSHEDRLERARRGGGFFDLDCLGQDVRPLRHAPTGHDAAHRSDSKQPGTVLGAASQQHERSGTAQGGEDHERERPRGELVEQVARRRIGGRRSLTATPLQRRPQPPWLDDGSTPPSPRRSAGGHPTPGRRRRGRPPRPLPAHRRARRSG